MEPVTTNTILNWLKESVEQKRVVDAHTWVDACQKLNVLIGDEHDKLYEMQQKVAQLRIARIESGDSVAKAKVYIEATEEHKKARKQEARIEQIQEAIRIAKIQARLKDVEITSY